MTEKIFDWQKTIPQIQYVLSDDVTPIRTVQNVHKSTFWKNLSNR